MGCEASRRYFLGHSCSVWRRLRILAAASVRTLASLTYFSAWLYFAHALVQDATAAVDAYLYSIQGLRSLVYSGQLHKAQIQAGAKNLAHTASRA